MTGALEVIGRQVVVTGGASGIGLALAEHYGAAGARVLIVDRNPRSLDDAVARLTADGVEVRGALTDLTDDRTVANLAKSALADGEIAVACFNAGVMSSGATVWQTPPETLDFLWDVNVRGLHNSICAFLPGMVRQGAAAGILVTASMAGLVASPQSGGYAASKAAAIALAKALRAELETAAPFLRVTLLAPGMVSTDLIRNSGEAHPLHEAMPPGQASAAQAALEQFGAQPAAVAAAAAAALDRGQFWALPDQDDPFVMQMLAEQAGVSSTASQQRNVGS